MAQAKYGLSTSSVTLPQSHNNSASKVNIPSTSNNNSNNNGNSGNGNGNLGRASSTSVNSHLGRASSTSVNSNLGRFSSTSVNSSRNYAHMNELAETDSRGGSTRPNSWQAATLPTRAGSPISQDGPTLGTNQPPQSPGVRKPSNGTCSIASSTDNLQGMPPMPQVPNPFESEPTWVSLAEYTSGTIHNLIQSAENGYKPYYQTQAAQVVQSIRVMFYASGTIDKDSAPIQLHRHLKGHHRQIMAALSRLVLSAKMASSVWPAEGAVTKMRSDADDVALSVHQFITTAQSVGVKVHEVDGKLIQDSEAPTEARSVRKLSRTISNSSKGSSSIESASTLNNNNISSSKNNNKAFQRRSVGSTGLQTQLDYYSKSASKAIALLSLQIDKVLEAAQNSPPRNHRPGDSLRAWSIMNSSQSSQLVTQCHQTISQIGSLLTLVGEYYGVVLSAHPSIKDHLFLDVRVSRQALYNSMAALMMGIQLATDPKATTATLESALDASQMTERSVADISSAARSLAAENDEADARVRSLRVMSESSSSTLVGPASTISGSEYLRVQVGKSGEVSDMDQDSTHRGTSRRSESRPSSIASDSSFSGPTSTVSPEVINRFQYQHQYQHSSSPRSPTLTQRYELAEDQTVLSDEDVQNLASLMEVTPPSIDFKSKVPLSNKAVFRGAKLRKLFGHEIPAPKAAPKVVEAPWYLGYDYTTDDITFNVEGQVKGGTLPALVERLTIHDSLDSNFVATFLLTYRSFATTKEFFELLFRRFTVEPPPGLTNAEHSNWTENKLTPIRLRVFNIIKSWLESYFLEDDPEDQQVLQKIKQFSESGLMRESMSFPAVQLIKLVEKRENSDVSFRKMILNLSTQAPQPITPRNLKRIRFIDLDALEFARQLTIMEATNYNKIKPIECLAKAWMSEDPELVAKAINIKKMISTTNLYSNWINEIVLSEIDVKKRAMIIRQIIAIAEKLLQLNNFSLLSATTAALNQSPIHRLKRTWEQVPSRFSNSFEKLRAVTSSNKNWGAYRAALHNANPPCVPFVGVYLTHLVMIQDANTDFLKSTEHHINFAKRVSTAEVIREIQQYQAVPYCLTAVPEIQTFIRKGLDNSKDEKDLFDMSLAIEPREGEEDKITRLLSESGFLNKKKEKNMDPRKLKVNELKEQLQLAGLSVNGKKEELVARLLDHQKAEEEALIAAGGPTTGTGEAFDWEDADDLAPPADPSAAPPVATSTPSATTEVKKTEPATSTTTATKATAVPTDSTPVVKPAATTSSAVGDVHFQGGAGKDAETLKAEHEKRKNRAARFGIPLKEQDKAIERAARFGVPVTASATASLAKATGTAAKTASSSSTSKTLPTKPSSIAASIPADVLSKRQERFGITAPVAKPTTSTTSSSSSATTPAAKGPAAAKNLYALDAAEEEKKRKRAAKFGASTDEASKKVKA
ncbi:hypothetical protein BGZ83_002671 [Gryganskiella cystojenkinii]|nr:hypothetical protein BGZ83_002671 [Gryganskiella cystojenkinii]